jgi:sortase (surface protein transpeptidase)
MEPLLDRLRALSGWWGRQAMAVRAGMLGVVGVLLGVVVALGVLGGNSEGSTDVVARTQTPTPTATATASASPTAASTSIATSTATATATATATVEPTETPEPTPTPAPTIGTIEELVARYGYPAGYDYAQIRIPKLGINAPVGSSYVGGDVMDVPEGPATVFWYDLSGWTDLGGLPGEGKNAIFSGHVDIASYLPYADVTYVGQGIFSNLHLLAPGDRIFVDFNGETLEYQVTWQKQIAASSSGWGDIWSSDVAVDSITLYTCGGEFDIVSASYIDRVVLRAERV